MPLQIAILLRQPPDDDDYYSSSFEPPEWVTNIWFVLIIIVPLILLKAGLFKDKEASSIQGCLLFGFIFATVTAWILSLFF